MKDHLELGMEIRRDRINNMLFLNYHEYFDKILMRFHMDGAKGVKVLLAQHFKFSRNLKCSA